MVEVGRMYGLGSFCCRGLTLALPIYPDLSQGLCAVQTKISLD